jgi:soluble cytochrome b562
MVIKKKTAVTDNNAPVKKMLDQIEPRLKKMQDLLSKSGKLIQIKKKRPLTANEAKSLKEYNKKEKKLINEMDKIVKKLPKNAKIYPD